MASRIDRVLFQVLLIPLIKEASTGVLPSPSPIGSYLRVIYFPHVEGSGELRIFDPRDFIPNPLRNDFSIPVKFGDLVVLPPFYKIKILSKNKSLKFVDFSFLSPSLEDFYGSNPIPLPGNERLGQLNVSLLYSSSFSLGT